MRICLAYFLLYSRKSLSYKHEVLPKNAIRSPTSEVQGEMAVLGGKNTFAVGFFFYVILKKRLAYSIRNVGKGNVDVQILLCMAIYNEFVRCTAQMEVKKCFFFYFSAKGAPAPLSVKLSIKEKHIENFHFSSPLTIHLTSMFGCIIEVGIVAPKHRSDVYS